MCSLFITVISGSVLCSFSFHLERRPIEEADLRQPSVKGAGNVDLSSA